MTTSFFNGESTFPENNTTDQLVDALQAQLTASTADSQAAQAAAVSAAASASNAAISEGNVAGLAQQANDTLAQANTAITAANAAATAAQTSATNAASSASAASASASTSGTAAGQASVSETNAAASASAALASKNAAGTSETNAAASATAANTSKVNAGTSETNAAASATSANTSKNAAATSAGNAATSETNALSSKNAAATSAANAATSEGNALTSQNAAAASALVAQNFTASLAGRNRIINGDMRVTQRPALAVTTGSSGYGQCDRWQAANSGGGTLTLSQTSLADETGVLKPFNNCVATVAATNLTGGNNIQAHKHVIEGVNAYDLIGKQVTVGFTVRSTIPGTFAVALRDGPGGYSCVQTFAIPTVNVGQRVSVTFPAIPSGATIPQSNAAGLALTIGGLNTGSLQTSSTNTWVAGNFFTVPGLTNWAGTLNAGLHITDVQLEAGTVATPFDRRSYAQERSLCMRYYQQSYSDGVAAGTNLGFTGGIAEATGGGASSPNTINLVRFPVEMRAAPSVTFYDSLGAVGKISTDGITNGVSSSSVDNLTTKVFKIFAAAVSRISFHYTANAEF